MYSILEISFHFFTYLFLMFIFNLGYLASHNACTSNNFISYTSNNTCNMSKNHFPAQEVTHKVMFGEIAYSFITLLIYNIHDQHIK